MSSHHIVRENQEPALLIMDAHAISFEKVQELLEWLPTVIVHYSQLEIVLGWGIKIDVVLVNHLELEGYKHKLQDQAPIRFLSFNEGEDPLQTAFYFLMASKASGVNVLLDNTEALEKIAQFHFQNIEVFINHKRWYLVRSGRFEKWYARGTQLFCHPSDVKLTDFVNGKRKVFLDGILHLETDQDCWIGEDLD